MHQYARWHAAVFDVSGDVLRRSAAPSRASGSPRVLLDDALTRGVCSGRGDDVKEASHRNRTVRRRRRTLLVALGAPRGSRSDRENVRTRASTRAREEGGVERRRRALSAGTVCTAASPREPEPSCFLGDEPPSAANAGGNEAWSLRGELICRSGTCAVAVRFIAEELDSGDMRRNALAERRITSSRLPSTTNRRAVARAARRPGSGVAGGRLGDPNPRRRSAQFLMPARRRAHPATTEGRFRREIRARRACRVVHVPRVVARATPERPLARPPPPPPPRRHGFEQRMRRVELRGEESLRPLRTRSGSDPARVRSNVP